MQLSDLVQVVQVFATLGLVYYAYVTIREAKNDRKKDTIERMLENVYSPLREILMRTRFESTPMRNSVRQVPFQSGPRDYVLIQEEFDQVRGIVEKFGHYFEPSELLKFRLELEKYDVTIPSYDPAKGPVLWYRFHNNDLDPRREYIERKCTKLREALQVLTGIEPR